MENDRVKIVEVRVAPGEKMPMHTHGPYAAYTMNSAKVRFILPDGTTRDQELEKGSCRYSPGVTHELENIGTTEIYNLDIELKEPKT